MAYLFFLVFTQSSDGYCFGIEIELTLSPKVQNIHQFHSSLLPGPMEDDGTYPWEQMATALTMLLDRVLWDRGMGRASQRQSYDKWCVTFDDTIQPPRGFCEPAALVLEYQSPLTCRV